MNNEFDKRINSENQDSLDCEKCENTAVPAVEEINEDATVVAEQISAVELADTDYEITSEETVEEAVTQPEEISEALKPDEAEQIVETEEMADVPEEASYNPQSDTYTYTKQNQTDTTEQTNCCIWGSSENSYKDESKSKRKTGSSKGFKVFVAVMLGVFTVSAACIAGFMAADYIEDTGKDSVNSQMTTNIPSNHGDYLESINKVISAFEDNKGGLTKSQVAAKCTPSAVGIVIEKTSNSSQYYDFGFFGNFYSTPQIVQGVGSGFIYNDDGYIITNHHVIEGAEKITVYLSDKTQVQAEIIGSDSLSDIAVIKINPEGLNLIPMEIGNSDLLVVGDEVIAIGCPAGIEYMGTVTDGIISAINRDVELKEDGKSTVKTMTLLQTNATINKGNSGGPLINSLGQVIGINTLKLGESYEGIGFSIPINSAVSIVEQLIQYGEVLERSDSFVSSEGVIGISVSPITESEAEYYDIPRGVLVVQIDKESSASKAGLRRGDIITAYNGTQIKTVEELNRLKAANKAGDEVTISVYRDAENDSTSKTFDLTFKLDMAK